MAKQKMWQNQILELLSKTDKALTVREISQILNHDEPNIRLFIWKMYNEEKSIKRVGKTGKWYKYIANENKLTNGKELFIESMELFLKLFQTNASNLQISEEERNKVIEMMQLYKKIKVNYNE